MISRLMIGVCGLVIAWTLHVTQRAESPRPISPPAELVAGRFHAVNVDADRAVLDLPCAGEQRYLLIVSSLGDSSRTFRVRLEAETREGTSTSQVLVDPICRQPQYRSFDMGVTGLPDSSPNGARFDSPGRSPGVRVPNDLSAPTGRNTPTSTVMSRPDGASQAVTNPLPGLRPGLSNPSPLGPRPADRLRPFDIHVGTGSLDEAANYIRVTARCVAESNSVRVFLDEQQAFDQSTREAATEILHLLENRIIPISRELIGTHADIDGDGKLAVLLTPVLDRVPAGQTPLGGYVRGSDYRRDMSPPFGNHTDVIYLNSRAVSPGEHLHALLAHEYTHAVGFSEQWRRSADGSLVRDEEDWLNEAIAHVAEQLHHAGWSNLDDRIERYLHAPHAAPLVVPDASRAGLWRDPGCRGASYLFLQWCVDQFGDDLLSKLIHSRLRGRANIEHATGVTFSELYRRWTIALCDAVPESSSSGYRTLRLRGPLGDAVLNGPTTFVWPLSGLASPSPLGGEGRGEGRWPDADAKLILSSRDVRTTPHPQPLSPKGRGELRRGQRPLPKEETRNAINLTLRGTATAFVEFQESATGGARRITVRADSGTALQLTLMPLVGADSSLLLVANKPPQPR
ncbi:MAG: hypothetical protein HZA46_14350 [Planctomycetales bacterium]|nr:hypothetical protein [Planctomycetales bacterium]